MILQNIMLILPLEMWNTVCDFVPLHTLQNFNFSNKTLFTYIKKHCPKLQYNENINYSNILTQLINIKTNFIIFSIIDYYESVEDKNWIWWPTCFTINIINNTTSDKKILFTTSQLSCYESRRGPNTVHNCLYNTVTVNGTQVLKHIDETNYCFNNKSTTINCPYTDSTHDHFTSHIHADSLELSIVDDKLKFTKNWNKYYNSAQYEQFHCVNCRNNCEKPFHMAQCVKIDSVLIIVPWSHKFVENITEYNFILEDDDVKQIYENVFIFKDERVISYFIKDGIEYYIMSQVS